LRSGRAAPDIQCGDCSEVAFYKPRLILKYFLSIQATIINRFCNDRESYRFSFSTKSRDLFFSRTTDPPRKRRAGFLKAALAQA